MALFFLVVGFLTIGIFIFINKFTFRTFILFGLCLCIFCQNALPWFSLPITGMAAVIKIVFICLTVVYFIGNKTKIKPIAAFLNRYNLAIVLLGMIFIIYLTKTEASTYGNEKTLWFFLNTIIPIVALSLISPFSIEDLTVICEALVLGSILMSLNVLILGDGSLSYAIVHEQYSPVVVGRTIGVGVVLLVTNFLVLKAGISKKLVIIMLLLVTISGLIYNGTRAPILASCFSIICFLLLEKEKFSKAIRIVLLFLLIGCIFTPFFNYINYSETGGLFRIYNYTFNNEKILLDINRLELYSRSIQMIEDSRFLGSGTGSFAKAYKEYSYPHNIFLEIMSEEGVIGFVVFICLIIFTITKINSFRLIETPTPKYLGAVWYYCFFNTLVAGDIAGNAVFWITGSIIFLYKN